MTGRIDRRFAALAKEGRAALVTFTVAGDPDYATALAILKALPKAGADVIELGMPFTDPMADGPAIQAAGLRALHAGQDMKKTLAAVREFRTGDDATPVVLMGYYNPIYIYGVEKFLADATAAGVDGLIVVDLPPEEDAELCLPAVKAGVNFIRLATPTTDDKRLPAVLTNTSGFVYYVSIAGITGSAAPDPAPPRPIPAKSPPRSRASSDTPSCRSASASASAAASRRAPSRSMPTVSWSARRWSTPCAKVSAPTPSRRRRPCRRSPNSSVRSPKACAARAASPRTPRHNRGLSCRRIGHSTGDKFHPSRGVAIIIATVGAPLVGARAATARTRRPATRAAPTP